MPIAYIDFIIYQSASLHCTSMPHQTVTLPQCMHHGSNTETFSSIIKEQ